MKRSQTASRWLCACAAVAAVVVAGGCAGGSSPSASTTPSDSSSPVATTGSPAFPTPAPARVPKTRDNGFGFSVVFDGAVLRQGLTPDITLDRAIHGARDVGYIGLVERAEKLPISCSTYSGDLRVVAVHPTDVTPTLTELQAARYLFRLFKRPPGRSLIDKADGPTRIEKTTVDGLHGYRVIQRRVGRTYVHYVLFEGDRTYLVKYDAKNCAWSKLGPVLEAVAQSLRVTHRDPPRAPSDMGRAQPGSSEARGRPTSAST